MTSLEEKIHAAASKNTELLAILAETDYAPPALDQQDRYITDLEQEITGLDSTIKKLEANRRKELSEHEKYRDSTVKRFAYKVARKSDKFEAKASKEEKEYFDALHEENQANEARKSTALTLTAAKQTRSDLQTTASAHASAQKDLDALYKSIFDGPTPGFPEEDARESAANTALSTYQTSRNQLESESQTVVILKNALQKMQSAMQSMDEARSYSRIDMFGGGTITDMMERSALAKADQFCMETQMLIMQAQRLSQFVKDIPKPNIAHGNLMRDVFFDNIFTDMDFHEKIKQSQLEVGTCAKTVEQEVVLAKKRLDDLKGKMQRDGKNLEEARLALQKAREAAFEVGGGVPPAYTV